MKAEAGHRLHYAQERELMFDDGQMGIYEKIVYYVESTFKKGAIDYLL